MNKSHNNKSNDDDDDKHNIIRVVKLSERARLPTKSSPLAAGYDLYTNRPYIIPANGKQLIDTDLQIALPIGSYGRIAPT